MYYLQIIIVCLSMKIWYIQKDFVPKWHFNCIFTFCIFGIFARITWRGKWSQHWSEITTTAIWKSRKTIIAIFKVMCNLYVNWRNVIRHSYHLYAKTWQRRSMQIRTDTGYIITIIGWRGMSLLALADIFYVSESTHTFLFVNWKFNIGAETVYPSETHKFTSVFYLSFFYWPLYCLYFYDWQLLIIHLVSSNFTYKGIKWNI